jgi:hypothetical protein
MSHPRPLARRVSQGITVIGAVIALLAMTKMGGSLASPFTAWVLLPFILTFVTLMRRATSWVGIVGLAAVSAVWSAGYLDLVFPRGHVNSTAGLAFVFVPLWQLLSYLVFAAISGLVDYLNATVICSVCKRRLSLKHAICPTCLTRRETSEAG